MKKLTIVMASVLTLMLTACEKINGEGPIVNENRSRGTFNAIDLRVSANVYYTQDPNHKIEVRAQQNILDHLQTYTVNDKLVIKLDNDVRVRRHEEISVYLSAPNLKSIRVSGSGNVTTTGVLTPSTMDLEVSGSGDIDITNINTDYLDANISGSGNIKVLEGKISEENLKVSGSGNINLADVEANTVSTNTSGSGDIRVNVKDRLNVRIAGSGSVYYRGQPIINTTISGSGKVRQL